VDSQCVTRSGLGGKIGQNVTPDDFTVSETSDCSLSNVYFSFSSLVGRMGTDFWSEPCRIRSLLFFP
jgi:hypothetical protein